MGLWPLRMNKEQPGMFGTSGEGDFLLLFQVVLRWPDKSSGVLLQSILPLDPGRSDLCSGPHALFLRQLYCFPLVKESSRQWEWTRKSPWHPLIQDPEQWNSLSSWPRAFLSNSWAVSRRAFGCCGMCTYLPEWQLGEAGVDKACSCELCFHTHVCENLLVARCSQRWKEKQPARSNHY